MMASCCVTLLVVILSINYWAADGYPACSHTTQDLGKCMSEEECKVSGGVKGSNSENNRCLNDVQANNGGEDKVYCTTYAHLAENLCSKWLPLWNKHDDSCNMIETFRIYGGEEAKEGEFKHLAAVGKWINSTSNVKWECGGTLITPHYVLTAAHCVVDKKATYHVRLGEYDFRDKSSKNTMGIKMEIPSYLHRSSEYNQIMEDEPKVKQTLAVKKVISHLKFDGHTSKKFDIALLELIEPVVLNKYALPACLPFDIEDEPDIGMDLIASGWGSTKHGGDPAEVVRKVSVPVVSKEKCEDVYSSQELTVTQDIFCAGAEGRDTCKGDSGGPLSKNVSQPDYPCGAQVFGIVSWGYRCGNVGIYTRVSFYLPWIMRYIAPDHYHQHITERIHSTGLQFDGKSLINFSINNIFTNGFRIQLYFKTDDHSGILITVPRKGSSLVLRMINGKIKFSESLGNVAILSEDSYDNGKWHTLTVECRPSIDSCYLKVDGETLEQQPWILPSTLQGDIVETLTMGGIDEDVNNENNFYNGCLVYSLSSSLRLRTPQSSLGTVTACDNGKLEEHLEEDQAAADRELLHLEHEAVEQKMNSMEQLLQDMASKMIDIQNFTLSQKGSASYLGDVSISGSKNTGCYPPFEFISSTTECLFFGKLPLTLYEANTTCQLMGAKLATPNDLAELRSYMHTHKLEVGHWVDGNDIKNGNDIFTWSSGEAVHADCWDTGFPKTINTGNSCLLYNPSWEGYRNTHSCSEDVKTSYICKNTDIGGVKRAETPKCIKSVNRE